MKGTRTAWVAAAAALLAYSTPATAVDFFGYFRDGFGGNSKGGGQTCFKTPGMDYKLRLGNECDNYGEWGLQQSIYKDKNGVEVTAGVMFAYDQPTAQGLSASTPVMGIQQGYFKMKFPQWKGATFWGGKQYYLRENIDMIDFFYLNTSDTGIGVQDVDINFGKLAFSIFSAKPATSSDIAAFRPDLRVYGIPLNKGGTITVDLNMTFISQNKDVIPKQTDQSETSFWITAEHHQEGILGGFNTFTVQWANGASANMANSQNAVSTSPGSGFVPPCVGTGCTVPGTSALNKNNQQIRVLDQLLLQPSAAFQVLVGGIYQDKTFGVVGGTKVKAQQYGVFARPKYWFSEYFNLQGDVGYTSSKFKDHPQDDFNSDANLLKFTIAPTLSPAIAEGSVAGFFVRPEFRVFYTYGGWNDTANKISANGASSDVNFGEGKTSGSTFGAQVEGWF